MNKNWHVLTSKCNSSVNISKRVFFFRLKHVQQMVTVDGPYSVVLQVVDVNNNPPVFSEGQYSGRVREHSPAGEKHALSTDVETLN